MKITYTWFHKGFNSAPFAVVFLRACSAFPTSHLSWLLDRVEIFWSHLLASKCIFSDLMAFVFFVYFFMSARARLLAFWQRKRYLFAARAKEWKVCCEHFKPGAIVLWPSDEVAIWFETKFLHKSIENQKLFGSISVWAIHDWITNDSNGKIEKRKSASVSQRLNGTETKNYTANVNSTNSTYNQSHMHKCDIHDMNKKSSARMKATVVKKKCGFVCCLCVSECVLHCTI